MNKLIYLFIVIGFLSCSIEPSPIIYGHEECHFCSMKIMDNRYAAELVTIKAKVYKYDALECMVNDLLKNKERKYKYKLTNIFTKPGKLVNVESCFFLISEKMPSPMGANLTAFENVEDAVKYRTEKGGEVYSWNALKDNL